MIVIAIVLFMHVTQPHIDLHVQWVVCFIGGKEMNLRRSPGILRD